jgi:hypothetical protein
VDSQSLTAKAHAIADQYLAAIPGTYNGRYSEIADPTVIQTIFEAISAGLKDKAACEAAGISTSTFLSWQRRAETEPDSAFHAFCEELKQLRQLRKVRILKRLEKASEKEQYWTAGAWLLERTEPEEFALRKDDSNSPKVIVQIGTKDGDISVSLSPISQGQLGEGQQNP